MPSGALAIPEDGFLDTSCISQQVLVLLPCHCQLILLRPIHMTTSCTFHWYLPYQMEYGTYLEILDMTTIDHKLYDYSSNVLGIDLVCPIERYESTSGNRLELMHFYESVIGQAIYRWRSISVEPLIEHIKSVFRIDPLPVRGYLKAAAVVLLSVLLYQLMVYYNCITGKTNPKSIKYMIGSY